MNKYIKNFTVFFLLIITVFFNSCSFTDSGKKIVRVSHNQSAEHPTNIGLEKFAEFINNSEIGNKFEVKVYPSELLGSQKDTLELTQTGAIDIMVASNAILESFNKDYGIFNLPYLFPSEEVYHKVMDDKDITENLFKSTRGSGFECVTWLDAGTRNFYTVDKPIKSPKDLKGLKIRVQQSATNIKMMSLLGGSATPMGFGEVYTALQAKVIDGAENNELALTTNKHGEVCKYYSYDYHQMVPDLIIANSAFLAGLDEKERKIFEEGFEIASKTQREAWGDAVEAAIKESKEKMNVEFFYPDVQEFKKMILPLHDEVLKANPNIKEIYDKIMAYK